MKIGDGRIGKLCYLRAPALCTLVDDGKSFSTNLQFLHFSVEEFLTSSRLSTSKGDVSHLYIMPEPAHMTFAQAWDSTPVARQLEQ